MSFSPSVAVGSFDYGNPFDVVLDNTGPSNQALYEGTAYPGTSTGSGVARWRIRKFFFDNNDVVQGWRWADSTTEMIKDWTLRASYTYTAL